MIRLHVISSNNITKIFALMIDWFISKVLENHAKYQTSICMNDVALPKPTSFPSGSSVHSVIGRKIIFPIHVMGENVFFIFTPCR